ncbi:MAG: penicillin-binding protein [Oscillospiraceae bacterium]|nr:penicillin-binding protein [Oscillospiraceae bacterium]
MFKIEKKSPLNKKRYFFIIGVIFIIFSIYVARLVDWQIINSDYYKARANNVNTYSIITDAVRGEILDCSGNGLAVNSTGYKIILDRLNINKDSENKFILKMISILERLKCSWIDILPIEVKNNEFVFSEDKKSQIFQIKKILELSADTGASECMEKMIKKYKCSEFSLDEKRKICSVKYNMDKISGYKSKITPYTLADNITAEAMAIFSELSAKLGGGVRVETSLIRNYINGTIAPHIVGYIGPISSQEYEKYKDKNYSIDAVIGKAGIESALESELRGKSGKRMVQLSRSGELIRVAEVEENVPGHTVFLTIDSELQEAANKSLAENIEKASKMGAPDCKSGAAVAIDVRDFSILAAATFPSYDLAQLFKDPSYYPTLAADFENTPLLGRAFNGAFAPGSVYKPLVACAGLQEGVITPDDTINCGGGYTYYKGYTLRCMGRHGNANLKLALSKSCNVFFAEVGRRLGATLLAEYANRFGMGVKTGLEMYEGKGIIAGPEYSKSVGAKWYESGSSQAAIGQSDNMITPLQLAVYTATIANGGNRYKTRLVKKITSHNKSDVILMNDENNAEFIENCGVSAENLNIIKDSMREVVLSGTARDFSGFEPPIAAKTGTAENPMGSDHTNFICFAPYDNPKIAVSVVIANGKYGIISKNVAKDILNQYFKTQNS